MTRWPYPNMTRPAASRRPAAHRSSQASTGVRVGRAEAWADVQGTSELHHVLVRHLELDEHNEVRGLRRHEVVLVEGLVQHREGLRTRRRREACRPAPTTSPWRGRTVHCVQHQALHALAGREDHEELEFPLELL